VKVKTLPLLSVASEPSTTRQGHRCEAFARREDRALEQKIHALEVKRKILVDRLKAREETTGDQGVATAAAQDHGKALERKVERKELAIAILANVIRLSNLPSEEG